MRKNNCEVVRQELDELMLGETYSPAASEHLEQCADCREFHQQQTKLRQMVGSLGTITAPADFDFRLRARLANDSSAAVPSQFSWGFARRGFAVALVLIVFATGMVMVRNVMIEPNNSGVTAGNDQRAPQQPPVVREEVKTPVAPPSVDPKELRAELPGYKPAQIKGHRNTQSGSRPKIQLTAVDRASTGAEVINGSPQFGSANVFSIDASLQSLRVSLDDGRGNARTISVPTISFGSQRMVSKGNQLAPKDVW